MRGLGITLSEKSIKWDEWVLVRKVVLGVGWVLDFDGQITKALSF